jgi:uncharacterized FlgJ-related protein
MITLNRAKEVYKTVINIGILDPEAKYIVAQAAHETGGFTSQLYKENHNLFGMKYPSQGYAQGSANGFAYYLSEESSIYDLQRWLILTGMTSLDDSITLADYVQHLKDNNYFEDTVENYYNGCNKFYKMIFG